MSVCQSWPASASPIGFPSSTMLERIITSGMSGSWYAFATLISSSPKRALKSRSCRAESCWRGKRRTLYWPSDRTTSSTSSSPSGLARFSPSTVAPRICPLPVTVAMSRSSIDLQPGVLDHLRVAHGVGAHDRRELLGRAGYRLVDADRDQLLARLGRLHRLRDLAVQAIHDPVRRPGGREDTIPSGELVPGHPGFSGGRHAGKLGKTLRARHCERAQFTAAH